MAKVLNIVESAYRATIEEQDDTIVWLTHAMKNAGADMGLLLKGNAVNYTVKGQDASGLTIGTLPVPHPPKLDEDLKTLMGKGVPVYAVKEDLKDRGIPDQKLLDGVKVIPREEMPVIFAQYPHVLHW